MSTSIKISIPLAAAAAVLLLAISSHAAEPDPFRPDPSFRPMTNGFVAQWRKANPDDPRNDFALTIDLGQSQPEALAKYPDFKADYDAIMAPPDAIPQVAERDSTFRFRLPTSGFGSLPYMTNRQERLSLARQINAYLNILDEMIPSLNSTDQQWVTNEMRRTKRLMSEKDKSWWDENHAFESSKQYKIWDTRNALEYLRSYSTALLEGKPKHADSFKKSSKKAYSERDELSDWNSFSSALLTSDLCMKMVAGLKLVPPPVEINGLPQTSASTKEIGNAVSGLMDAFINMHADWSGNH